MAIRGFEGCAAMDRGEPGVGNCHVSTMSSLIHRTSSPVASIANHSFARQVWQMATTLAGL